MANIAVEVKGEEVIIAQTNLSVTSDDLNELYSLITGLSLKQSLPPGNVLKIRFELSPGLIVAACHALAYRYSVVAVFDQNAKGYVVVKSGNLSRDGPWVSLGKII
jgi:hypothetical protein